MEGRNTIYLNKATMQEAVQYWLVNVFLKEKVVVTNVKESHQLPNDNTFQIDIEPEIYVSE